MNRIVTRFCTLCIGIAALLTAPLALTSPAAAQSYPSQLVKIIIPFTAGINKINADVVAMLHTPEAQAKLAAQFVIPVTDTPEQFDKTIRDETANLTQVFKEAGVGRD